MRYIIALSFIIFSVSSAAGYQYGFNNNVVYKRDSIGTVYWAKDVSCQWVNFTINSVTHVNRSGDRVYVISQQLGMYGPRGIIVLDTNGNFINAGHYLTNDFLRYSLIEPSLFPGGWLISAVGSTNGLITVMKFDSIGFPDTTRRVFTGGYEWDTWKKLVNTSDSGAVILTLGYNTANTIKYPIVTRVDKNCQMLWHYAYYNQNFSLPIEFGPESMAIDSAGFFYIKGKIFNDVEYGHYLIKLDANGNEVVTRFWKQNHFFPANDLYFENNELTMLSYNNGLQRFLTFKLDTALNNVCYPYDSTISIPRLSLPIANSLTGIYNLNDTAFIPSNSLATASPLSVSLNYCNPTNVEEISGASFSLFPNPVEEELNIRFNNADTPDLIRIYNVTGEKIIELAFADKISLNGLAPGIYVISLKVNDQQVSKRFVKTGN